MVDVLGGGGGGVGLKLLEALLGRVALVGQRVGPAHFGLRELELRLGLRLLRLHLPPAHMNNRGR